MFVRFSCLTEKKIASYVPNCQLQCLIPVLLERDSKRKARKAIKILKINASRVSVESKHI